MITGTWMEKENCRTARGMGSPRHVCNKRRRTREGPEPACVQTPFFLGVAHAGRGGRINVLPWYRPVGVAKPPVRRKGGSRMSILNEEKLIILLQVMNNFDEINNFFMNNYWNKIGIFVKLISKVVMKWKNRSDFTGLHSMNFREEN